MSTTEANTELEQLITEAELTAEEADSARHAVSQGIEPLTAIEAELEARPDAASDQQAPPPVDPESDEPTPKQLRQLRKAADDYVDTVREIMGQHVDGFTMCEACSGLAMTPPDEGPPPNPLFKECPVCEGWSVVRTGSKNGEHAHRACPECKGRGYLERLGPSGIPVAPDHAAAQYPPPGEAEPFPAPADGEPVAADDGGAWGAPSWMGDPNIGPGQ